MAPKLNSTIERITDDILKTAIANNLHVNESVVSIESWEWSQGARPGENFVTDVYAVIIKATVDGQGEEFNYAIKTKAVDEFRANMYKKSALFLNECQFYNSVLPRLNSFRNKANLPPLKMVRTFYASDEDGVVVMENLKAQGFDTFRQNSVEGLSIECCENVMINLAQFHATSYHDVQTYPGGEEQFIKDYHWYSISGTLENAGPEEWKRILNNYLVKEFLLIMEFIKKFSNLGDELEKQLIDWEQKLSASRKPPTSSFAMVCHGDTRASNTLFRMKKNGSVEDIALIDFQILAKASPAFDLAYFLYGNVHPDLRRSNEERLLKLYHETLVNDLSSFGYSKDIFTLDDLKEDWKRSQFNGYAWGFRQLTGAINENHLVSKECDKDNAIVKKIISYVELAKELGI